MTPFDPDRVFGRTLQQLTGDLRQTLAIAAPELSNRALLEELVPSDERRRVWRELARRGYRLPPLELSNELARSVFVNAVTKALASALWSQNPFLLLSTIPLAILGWLFVLPWATEIPQSCRTLGEAAIHCTRVTKSDRAAGLWTRDEIALKVRMIVAAQLNQRLDEIREETSLASL